MQDPARTSVASIRAEIRSRAYSSNTGSRRYRRRRGDAVARQQSATTAANEPSTITAGQCTLVCKINRVVLVVFLTCLC